MKEPAASKGLWAIGPLTATFNRLAEATARQSEAPNSILLPRHFLGLFYLPAEIVELDRHSKTGVRLDPSGRVRPIVAWIKRSDVGKPTVYSLRRNDALQRLDGELVVLTADGVPVVTSGRNLEDHRLALRARSGVQLLDYVATGMLVHFIGGRKVYVQAVHLGGIGRQRPE